jgi:diguanylate cyclase (GGDEF)-like protein/PAS domain S-box-containing protein
MDSANLAQTSTDNNVFPSILDFFSDAAIALNNKGQIQLMNAAAEMLTGWPAQLAIGKLVSDVLIFSGKSHEVDLLTHMRRFIINSGTAQLISRHGTIIPVEFCNYALPNSPFQTLTIIRDISRIKRLEQKLAQQNEHLDSLHTTALSMKNGQDLKELLEALVRRVAAMVGTPHCYIYTVAESKKYMEMQFGMGVCADWLGLKLKRGEALCGKVWETGQVEMNNRYQSWINKLEGQEFVPIRSIIGVPLKSGDKVIGVIGIIFEEEGREFKEDEILLLDRFARLASLFIENAKLYADIHQELAERKRTEEALQSSEEKFRAISTAAKDGILLVNQAGKIAYWNSTTQAMFGYQGIDLLNRDARILLSPKYKRAFEKGLRASSIGKNNEPFECVARRMNGSEFPIEMSIAAIRIKEQWNLVAIMRDITERKLLEDKLTYFGLHDALTDLYNRTSFEQEISRLEDARYAPVGIVVCDIDGLKLVNDTMGHLHGDSLLRAGAAIIRKVFNKNEITARIGGDEFAILIPNTSVLMVESACHCLRRAVRDYNLSNQPIPLSMSVGFAVPTGQMSMEEVFKIADNNMYREKLYRSQSTRSAVVQTLISTMEARDYVTEGHAERLEQLAEGFAASIGLDETRVTNLRLLAQFHDIGKVGIPDDILFKPGPLTREETMVMQRHCEIGHRIAQSADSLQFIAELILKHHEWWNGQGYPLGLSGENIPLECRILAIIDAYDAMTNDRPYRKALSHVEAIKEIKRCANTQFDPFLVDIFLSFFED